MLIPLWPDSPKFSLSLFASLLLVASRLEANPIQLENAKAGTTAWQLSKGAESPDRRIRSATSVNRGAAFGLFN